MSDTLTVDTLAELLNTAAHKHHEVFMEADGIDPDWAMWYAGFLQAHLFDHVEKIPARSSLIHLLIQADMDHPAMGGPAEWTPVYAADMLPKILGA